MDQEEYVKCFREMLAAAVAVGIELSEKPYGAELWHESNRAIWDSIQKLYSSTSDFMALSEGTPIPLEAVCPLYEEMKNVTEPRS